jgi:hypothetical protein
LTNLVPARRAGGDDDAAEVVRQTLEMTPRDATHWSLRSMAKAAGFAPSTIHRIWKAFNLHPYRTETFKLSTDPLFVEKAHDIIGLYLSAPERALILCVDEKSQIQALDRSQPLLPVRPGQIERRTHYSQSELCRSLAKEISQNSRISPRRTKKDSASTLRTQKKTRSYGWHGC